MTEKMMRKAVVAGLRRLGAFSVENGVGAPGVPDVALTCGWLELKVMESWPVSTDSALRVPHFTPEQKVWHLRWARVGGRSWVLVKVDDDWVLLSGEEAARHLGNSCRAELAARARAWWHGRPDWDKLAEILCS